MGEGLEAINHNEPFRMVSEEVRMRALKKKFIFSRIKKGEGQRKEKCHAMMHCDVFFLPLSFSTKSRVTKNECRTEDCAETQGGSTWQR